MGKDQLVLQIRRAQRIHHGTRHKFKNMLGDINADEGAGNNGARGVNQTRAQLGKMLKKRHLAAVFCFLQAARQAGIRHLQVSRKLRPVRERAVVLRQAWRPAIAWKPLQCGRILHSFA